MQLDLQSQLQHVYSLDSLETIPLPAFICDPAKRIVRFNSKMADLLGEPSLRDRNAAEFGLDYPDTAPHEDSRKIRTQKGEVFNVTFHGEQLRDPDGKPVGTLNIVTTVEHGDDGKTLHELRRTQEEVIEARESSRRALQVKSDFLSNMSHELRTPLNAILGMSEALWETNLSDEQRELLSVLRNGGKTLLGLINDILEFSRLEAGKLPLEETSFKIMDPVRSVCHLLTPAARQKNVSLSIENAEVSNKTVKGDPKRLEQILTNLVGNAIKFTNEGSVTIRITRRSDQPSVVQMSVSDTGIGIAEAKLAEVFERFNQIDMGITKTYGGTGLGLAICKQLIDLMGGSIWVESKEGNGTTFHFTLNLPAVSVSEPPHMRNEKTGEKQAIFPGLRILVVEDSQDNAFLISTFLKNTHCTLDFAKNGQEAVDKFEDNAYDLILMDMQMPEMDGYAATRWIRALSKSDQKRIPIIALTAFAFAEEVQKSFDAGCDMHLTKPIDKYKLLKAIAECVEGDKSANAQP